MPLKEDYEEERHQRQQYEEKPCKAAIAGGAPLEASAMRMSAEQHLLQRNEKKNNGMHFLISCVMFRGNVIKEGRRGGGAFVKATFLAALTS